MRNVFKVLAAFAALVAGQVVAGAVAPLLHVPPPAIPAGASPGALARASLLGALLVVVAVAPLAAGLRGRSARRWMALGVFLFVSGGVNTAVEASTFNTGDGTSYLLLGFLLASGAASAVLATAFGSGETPPAISRLGAAGWTWRLAVGWLAFPAIYLALGACVAPLVMPYYEAGVAGLRLPPMEAIVATQLLRGGLFLASALAVALSWAGPLRRFVLAFGAAHAAVVGLYGMITATWLPAAVRLVHAAEMTADSFAYALALGLLFGRRRGAADEASLPRAPGQASA